MDRHLQSAATRHTELEAYVDEGNPGAPAPSRTKASNMVTCVGRYLYQKAGNRLLAEAVHREGIRLHPDHRERREALADFLTAAVEREADRDPQTEEEMGKKALLIACSMLMACSTEAQAPGQAAAGGASGTGDGGGGAGPMCWEKIGTLVVPGEACLDSGLTERIEVCFGEYLDDDRAFCMRRLADDAELWFVISADPVLDTANWAECESTKGNPKPLPPPPCFAAACPELNVSLPQTHVASGCSEAETKNYFSCGVVDSYNVSMYDENCCPRRPCTDVTGCEAGEECRSVFIRDALFCFLVDSVDDESDELVCGCHTYEGSSAVEQLFCMPETY